MVGLLLVLTEFTSKLSIFSSFSDSPSLVNIPFNLFFSHPNQVRHPVRRPFSFFTSPLKILLNISLLTCETSFPSSFVSSGISGSLMYLNSSVKGPSNPSFLVNFSNILVRRVNPVISVSGIFIYI